MHAQTSPRRRLLLSLLAALGRRQLENERREPGWKLLASRAAGK